jgi:hypothetical protein
VVRRRSISPAPSSDGGFERTNDMAASARRSSRPRRPASRTRGWQICGWLSAGLYLTVALGFAFPLPRRTFSAAGKDTTTPFPCMNSPCGCRTAEHCWHNCCCHTLAERIEWARENHVRPPDDVLAEAKAQGIEWECVADDAERCEAHGTGCDHCHAHPTTAKGRPLPAHGIVLIKALECQGLGGEWLTSGASLPPPPVADCCLQSSPPARIMLIAEAGISFTAEPPTPPPRLAA